MEFVLRMSNRVIDSILRFRKYYEPSRSGYGDKFEDQLFIRLYSLQRNPFQGRTEIISGEIVRIIPSQKPKFSHIIIFQVDDNAKRIYILSIPHTSTNWRI